MTDAEPQDLNKPVAYDAEGRPLYAHPAEQTAAPVPSPAPAHMVVHTARLIDPVEQIVSPETQRKHQMSKRRYPQLNLSAGEYVIRSLRRHPIGLFVPVTLGIFGIALVFTVLLNYDVFANFFALEGAAADVSIAFIPLLFAGIIIGLVTYASYFVYTSNRFFLTNESVIQEIQMSLFAKHEQTVSLSSIEDASFQQKGILSQIFNYGSVRLSTEGDETTYHFTYVAYPKNHIAVLNNAVEAFKNGRPVLDKLDS